MFCSRENVIGTGVEDEDKKHTWMEDAEAVSDKNILFFSPSYSALELEH